MQRIFSRLLKTSAGIPFVLVLGLGCVGDGSTLPSFVDQGISKVILELTNTTTGEPTAFEWELISGINGSELAIDTLMFADSVIYNCEVSFLDTLGADLSSQIEQNPEEFQIFYSFASNVDSVSFEITDKESDYPGGNQTGDDLKVGLKFEMALFAQNGGQGLLIVTLSHYTRAVKAGSNRGDDIFTEVEFPLTVSAVDTTMADPVFGFVGKSAY